MKGFLLISLLAIGQGVAGELVLIEPGVTYRGNGRNLQSDFPFTNVQQYYGENERPEHYAFITKPFYLSKTEVTVGEFRRFVEATGYQTDAEKSGAGIVGWSPSEFAEDEEGKGDRHDFLQKPEFTWKQPGFEQGDEHPVVGVSWQDAKAYCRWLSETEKATYRLPTEAEWEMAARAGTRRTHFYWGNAAHGEIHRYANIGNVELEKVRKLAAVRHWAVDVTKEPEDGFVFTAPVGSFKPNAFGLHDMSGNVLEWCEDYFNFTYYDHWMPKEGPNPVAVDPLNTSEKDSDVNQRRSLRGGSWYLGPLSARCSARNFFDQEEGTAYIGFRVVREATKEEASKFANPHESYLANVEKLTTYGAKFSPINRAAQIHLPNEPLSPELARAIVAIPGLHIIANAMANPWTQEIWDSFAGADEIRQFSVRGEGLEALDLSDFAGQQKGLTSLDLGSAGTTDANLKQLAALDSLQNFSLGCRPGAVSDAGIRHLAANRGMTTLRLYESEVSGEFLDAFTGSSLLVLNVTRSRQSEAMGGWTKRGSELLVASAPKLIELNLGSQMVTDADLVPLGALERLASLTLSECPNLTDEGIVMLASRLSRLESLYVGRTAAGPALANEVPRLYFLKTLEMGSTGLSDAALGEISRSRSLRKLRLEVNEIPAAYTAAGLASLWRIPNLESLQVDAPVPLDDTFQDFAAAPSLKELTLHAGSLSDALIALLPRIGTLERLNIQRVEPELFDVWKEKIAAVSPRLKVQKR